MLLTASPHGTPWSERKPNRQMKNHELGRVIRLVGRAIGVFDLIEEGDRILVALSGGKDSWSLLYALAELRRRAPISYELAAVTVHPGPVDFDCGPLAERLAHDGIPYRIVQGNIVELVNEKLTEGTNPCSFCSRLRRGFLYTYAREQGWNKIALGHHLDDFVETLLLNLFFNGSLKGMSPYLVADDGWNTIIRPLVYVREEMTRDCARSLRVPILGCHCDCVGMKGSRRQWVKTLIRKIETDVPDVRSNMLAAMGRIHSRHLLADRMGTAPSASLSKRSEGVE
jgi:tRNA 2-thiocytidine biosynthesis protein TtcA